MTQAKMPISRSTGADRTLGIGIVGAGYVARTVHIPFLMRLPFAKVLAIADSKPERALDAASRYQIPTYTQDYEDLLSDGEIDVIDICTPPQTHAKLILAAIRAKKSIIVEKPLSINTEEALAVKHALERTSSAHLGVVLNLRYMPLAHTMLQLLHSGRLGEIRAVTATIHTVPPAVDWLDHPVLSTHGVLYDYFPHMVDLVTWALQAVPKKVRCVSSSASGRDFYVIVDLQSPLTGECSFLIDVKWTSATSIRALQFWGTERDLFVDLQDQFWFLGRGHLTPLNRTEEFIRRVVGLAGRVMRGPVSVRYGAMVHHRDLLRDFLDAFRKGECPRISVADGLLHTALIDAAVRSSMEDRAVPIDVRALMVA